MQLMCTFSLLKIDLRASSRITAFKLAFTPIGVLGIHVKLHEALFLLKMSFVVKVLASTGLLYLILKGITDWKEKSFLMYMLHYYLGCIVNDHYHN